MSGVATKSDFQMEKLVEVNREMTISVHLSIFTVINEVENLDLPRQG